MIRMVFWWWWWWCCGGVGVGSWQWSLLPPFFRFFGCLCLHTYSCLVIITAFCTHPPVATSTVLFPLSTCVWMFPHCGHTWLHASQMPSPCPNVPPTSPKVGFHKGVISHTLPPNLMPSHPPMLPPFPNVNSKSLKV